jgi:FGGY-family pentulose kinase
MSPVPDTAGPFVLGIDFGTESCRAAIFDLTGRPVTFAATGYTTTHPRPGWAEQSPDDWWEALVASVRKAMADSGIPAHAIAALSYDATTCTVVALDERGDALRPAIMWMDVRATEQAARAGQSTHPARRYNGGGTMPATAEWFPFKAAWLKDNEPDTYAAAYRIVDAPDWVTFRLTGRWTANINSAALRAYYDRDLGGWPTGFYEEIGCADVLAKVPEDVVALGQPIGELTVAAATALGLRPGTLVAQGCADAWAGQIGLGVLQPGKMALITGSSHVLTGQTDQRINGQGFFGAYTDGVLPGQYTVEGGQVSTGSVLKWFKDNYCRDLVDAAARTGLDVYEILNHRSRDIPIGSEGLIVCEYWQGNRTPYTDSKARGIIWGLSLHHGPEHLYHAIQEGVCYGTAHILRSMAAAGFAVEEIVACGGATKSRDWVQMHSDVTGVPVTLTEVGDAVVLGACMLAATGAGLYPDLAAAGQGMVHEVDRVEPDPQRHAEYQFFVDRYCDTYPLLRPLIHDMTDHVVHA